MPWLLWPHRTVSWRVLHGSRLIKLVRSAHHQNTEESKNLLIPSSGYFDFFRLVIGSSRHRAVRTYARGSPTNSCHVFPELRCNAPQDFRWNHLSWLDRLAR